MHKIEIPHKTKPLSLFHINACSLNKTFDDLQHLLSYTKKIFEIIAINETRIKKQISLSNDPNLKGMLQPIFCIDINTQSDRK